MILPPDLTSINWLRSVLEKSTLLPEFENKSVVQIEALLPLSFILGDSREKYSSSTGSSNREASAL